MTNASSATFQVCPTCSEALEPSARYCTTCGGAVAGTAGDGRRGLLESAQAASCPQCGAAVLAEAGALTLTCPFCNTPLIERRTPGPGELVPEFVIPFAVTREQAAARFDAWRAAAARWRDAAAKAALGEARLEGVYVPFWAFQARTLTDWQARIGEHWYETEHYTTTEHYTDAQGHHQTRTVHRTRQVLRTDWYTLSSQHHRYHPFVAVVASRGLPAELLARVEPFDPAGLRRYQPDYLSGWQAEWPAVSREEALAQARARLGETEAARITASLPGDTHELERADTAVHDVFTDLVLMPLWIATFAVGEARRTFLVNGQTGTGDGQAPPFSRTWITLAVGLVVLAALLGLALVGWLGAGGP
jgi:hypothetical protein